MRWKGRRGSSNIEDRRRTSAPRRTTRTNRRIGRAPQIGRRGGGRTKAAGGGGLALIAVVVIIFLIDPNLLTNLQGPSDGVSIPSGQTQRELTQEDIDMGEFVSVTLADTEEVWAEIFADQIAQRYRPVTLVLFTGVTRSPCGNASGATGPFYCPADKKAYLDTDFFKVLDQRLGAAGDFAAAYVIAHEVAHHVQNELGILGEMNARRQRASTRVANEISVRIELQADCFSGLWAREAERKFDSLEVGDLDEALRAARQIGDDTLQRNAGRVPQPHTYTHGTSEQRQRWFQIGYETGELRSCDTFRTDNL